LGIVPAFVSEFSCLGLFIAVEWKHKAALANFHRMPPFLILRLVNEEAEAEDQGQEVARGVGGGDFCGAG
jgi:hypothetical protein